jgi:CAP-Gly domain-containing linker protein 1
MKEKLARYQKKSSKTKPTDVINQVSSPPESIRSAASLPEPQLCEICEQPGHDIFTCDLLQEGPSPTANSAVFDHSRGHRVSSDLFCEDCASPGHLAADCPHSLDVF